MAAARQVEDRLRHLPTCRPTEVVRRCARHDIGLALESPSTINHDLCVSNKIFTYLLAGIPAVATDTKGQRRLCRAFPTATRLVPPADPAALAQAVRELCAAPGARAAARDAGSAMCWDNERTRFLACVARVLAPERAAE
jgi:glycosyltransferase involved in cell wall biosynthesis